MPIVTPGIFIDQPHVWYKIHGHEYATTSQRDAAFTIHARRQRCAALVYLMAEETARHEIEIETIAAALDDARIGCEHEMTDGKCTVCGLEET